MRNKRGISIIELLLGLSIALYATMIVINFVHGSSVAWTQTTTQGAHKEMLARTVGELIPEIRNAMSVNVANSNANQITLVMPAVDANGKVVAPLTAGNTVAFYLSDLTGAVGNTGTVLWESINGVPQTTFALMSGQPVVSLGTNGLAFAYSPAANPTTVSITIQSAGTVAIPAASVTNQVVLINNQP